MHEKQNYPTWLVTRIWFFANCILSLILLIIGIIEKILQPDNGDGIGIYFGAILIGFFISSPSLILLLLANGFYNKKRFPTFSIKKYTVINIIINIIYLLCSRLFFHTRIIEALVFYAVTTAAGLLSHFILTRKPS